MNNYRMYRVSVVGVNSSPWDLLAKSPESAMVTIRKFYPQTQDMTLSAQEITLDGDPMTLVHALAFGESFYTILRTETGKPVMRGPEYIRGDFNPALNQYQCHEVNRIKPIYLSPYEQVIRLEDCK